MTGRNPNVFYEVGYAHARGKLCTLLTQSADDIPFDLRHHRHIIYDGSIQTLKQKLSVELAWLKKENERRKTNAITIELKNVSADLKKNSWSAEAELDFVFDLHNKTSRKSPDIEAIYLYTSQKWSFKQAGAECPKTVPDSNKNQHRHFVQSPVPRLSPGAWAQIKLSGTKTVWTQWGGEELKEEYKISGVLHLELSTSEGSFREALNVSVTAEELPF